MSALRFTVLCVAALAAGCAGSSGSKSSDTTTAPAATNAAPLRREDTAMSQVQARVTAVDQKKRLVTIQDESGGKATFEADPAVKNFKQIHVGDEVVGTLLESLVLELRQPTEQEKAEGPTILEVVSTAEPGHKPAGDFVRQIRAVLVIDAIDKTAGTATLRGPAGNDRTIKARDPRNLDLVKVGDTVVATYTEALRLEVRAPAAPAKTQKKTQKK
jgi:hypothetical protein